MRFLCAAAREGFNAHVWRRCGQTRQRGKAVKLHQCGSSEQRITRCKISAFGTTVAKRVNAVKQSNYINVFFSGLRITRCKISAFGTAVGSSADRYKGAHAARKSNTKSRIMPQVGYTHTNARDIFEVQL